MSRPTAANAKPVRALAAIVLVAAGAAAWSCRSDDVPRDRAAGGSAATATPASAELAPKYRDAIATLQHADTAEEVKLALVQELVVDDSEPAIGVLLVGTKNPSVLVSMASIKGLGRRPCAVVSEPLQQLLDDEEWQRRAWAAKVLGDTQCRDALRALTDHLQHERDGRVQQRLEAAIKALNEEARQ